MQALGKVPQLTCLNAPVQVEPYVRTVVVDEAGCMPGG